MGAREEDVVIEPGRFRIKNKFDVPLDGEGNMLVNYAGKWAETFHHYSFVRVLQAYAQTLEGEKPSMDLREFKDKIIN